MRFRQHLGRAAAVAVLTSTRVAAQESNPPPQVPAYRAPLLAMVQPAEGGVVPQDRPVVVFRFTAGEAGDPIDARSFAVTVAGEDRTVLFQLSATEAWGPLVAPGLTIERGTHELEARICSARGACSLTRATVTVGPSGPGSTAAGAKQSQRRTQLVDALLSALRTLLRP
jgi:hypothetical protein